jgi:hypothetical protein
VHLKNAIDCISNKKFEEAKSILINSLNKDPYNIVEGYELLKKIHKHNKINKFSIYTQMYLDELVKNSKQIEIYKLLHEDNNKSINNEMIFLDCLLDLGKYDEYKKYSVKILKKILNAKYYNHYIQFSTKNEKYIEEDTFFLMGKIIFNFDTGNEAELIVSIKKLLKKFDINYLEYSQALLNTEHIIADYNFNSVSGVKLKMKLRLIKNKIKNISVSDEELLNYIYLCDNKNDYFIINELTDKLEIKQYIKNSIDKISKTKFSEVPLFYVETRKSLKSSINIINKKINTNEHSIFEIEKETQLKKDDHHIFENKIDLTESEKIKLFIENEEQVNYEGIVTSLISMGMYQTALIHADKIIDLGNRYYLKSELNYKLNNFSESIYWINKSLTELLLDESGELPFIYLKALVFEKNNEPSMAQKYFREVVVIDPTYRSVGDKIKL